VRRRGRPDGDRRLIDQLADVATGGTDTERTDHADRPARSLRVPGAERIRLASTDGFRWLTRCSSGFTRLPACRLISETTTLLA